MKPIPIFWIFITFFFSFCLIRTFFTHLQDDVAVSQWETDGISASSQGFVWRAKKIRTLSLPFKIEKEEPFPTADYSCTHWVVVTTIFDPTEVARNTYLLSSRWCGVFVGDRKSPPSSTWRKTFPGDKLVFLDVQAQMDLPYSINKLLPFDHFSRKNIGYMYAIHHGAKEIYDGDDDNVFTDLDSSLTGEDIVVDSHVYNPYPSFEPLHKDRTIFAWPRGFPMGLVMDDTSHGLYWKERKPLSLLSHFRPGVVQYLAQEEPDVDAIYRLTRQLPVWFALKKTAIVVPKGVSSPFNAQATLFYHDAFWGLLLPSTVHGRVTDIWRAYFTQRLMWDLDLRLVFASPVVSHRRNAHRYMADFNAELPLYERAEELIKHLVRWSSRAPTLEERIFDLVKEAYEIGIVELSDVCLMLAWISDLKRAGYVFPVLGDNFMQSFPLRESGVREG